MKPLVPVLGAGGAFAGCALAGLAAGIFADERTGAHLFVVVGLFCGVLAGGYAAIRLLLRSM